MVILIAGLFCLARKRVEYLRNLVFYHRAKGEHPERRKNIKITNKTTPEKTKTEAERAQAEVTQALQGHMSFNRRNSKIGPQKQIQLTD